MDNNSVERRQASEGLQATTEVVSVDEVSEMAAELVVIVLVEAFDNRFLERAVHPVDLAVGPRMLDLGQTMLDAVFPAAHVEHVRDPGRGRAVGIARREGELDAVVGQNRVDLVGNRLDQGDEKGRGGDPRGLCLQPDKGEFARPINGYEEMEPIVGKTVPRTVF